MLIQRFKNFMWKKNCQLSLSIKDFSINRMHQGRSTLNLHIKEFSTDCNTSKYRKFLKRKKFIEAKLMIKAKNKKAIKAKKFIEAKQIIKAENKKNMAIQDFNLKNPSNEVSNIEMDVTKDILFIEKNPKQVDLEESKDSKVTNSVNVKSLNIPKSSDYKENIKFKNPFERCDWDDYQMLPVIDQEFYDIRKNLKGIDDIINMKLVKKNLKIKNKMDRIISFVSHKTGRLFQVPYAHFHKYGFYNYQTEGERLVHSNFYESHYYNEEDYHEDMEYWAVCPRVMNTHTLIWYWWPDFIHKKPTEEDLHIMNKCRDFMRAKIVSFKSDKTGKVYYTRNHYNLRFGYESEDGELLTRSNYYDVNYNDDDSDQSWMNGDYKLMDAKGRWYLKSQLDNKGDTSSTKFKNWEIVNLCSNGYDPVPLRISNLKRMIKPIEKIPYRIADIDTDIEADILAGDFYKDLDINPVRDFRKRSSETLGMVSIEELRTESILRNDYSLSEEQIEIYLDAARKKGMVSLRPNKILSMKEIEKLI